MVSSLAALYYLRVTQLPELFAFFKNSTLQSPGLNPIINVVPGDFTHDGKLDILVMTAPTRKANQLDMFLYVGSVTGGFGWSRYG